MSKRNTIRLTESELKGIIAKSVKGILNENTVNYEEATYSILEEILENEEDLEELIYDMLSYMNPKTAYQILSKIKNDRQY